MKLGKVALVPAMMLGILATPGAGRAEPLSDPMRFFEGQTESISTVTVVMKRPFRSRSIGRGKTLPDRTLDLVQRVEDEGKPVHERRWKIRQVGPGRYSGTMSEAVGPVVIEDTPKGFRFQFKMKGNLAVEQWLVPQSDGEHAQSRTIIRKFGIPVARSEGTIRKIG